MKKITIAERDSVDKLFTEAINKLEDVKSEINGYLSAIESGWEGRAAEAMKTKLIGYNSVLNRTKENLAATKLVFDNKVLEFIETDSALVEKLKGI